MQKPEIPKVKKGFWPKPTDSQRCRAQSKQRKDRCNKYARPGKTLCRNHGASREGVPNREVMTHGDSSAFVRKTQLPEIVARMRDLDTRDGKSEFIKLRTALTETVADNIAPVLAAGRDDAMLEMALKVEDRLAKNVALLHEMDAEKASAVPTTFVVANFDPQQHAPFQSRTIDGPCQIRYLDGEAFMLENRCWVPVLKQIDEESGAEYYVRLLEG